MSSSDLKSMAHGPDMMDLDDQNLKDRDDYELDSDELGHLFTSLSRPTYHGSTGHGGNAENCQIRRAFSFSVGDTGSMTVSQNKKSGLALNTNFVGGFGHEGGSMSAGGIGAERVNNGSRWNELLMAATEATELEKVS